MNKIRPICSTLFLVLLACGFAAGQIERERGTLVVAVPVNTGLVACADKRLFNADAGTFTDEFVKIRKASDNALFAATNTIGFYDRKSRKMAFDAFEITQNYASRHSFTPDKQYWDGLKQEIREKLVTYLSGQPYENWPETDTANKGLLFNLIFYSVNGDRAYRHTLKVFYEKKKTPVITIPDAVTEEVRFPKLSGKGREVMRFLAGSPTIANDPAILRFDERSFVAASTRTSDAVDFARKLFALTNTEIPKAQVSSAFDCALLDHATGFRRLET